MKTEVIERDECGVETMDSWARRQRERKSEWLLTLTHLEAISRHVQPEVADGLRDLRHEMREFFNIATKPAEPASPLRPAVKAHSLDGSLCPKTCEDWCHCKKCDGFKMGGLPYGSSCGCDYIPPKTEPKPRTKCCEVCEHPLHFNICGYQGPCRNNECNGCAADCPCHARPTRSGA